MKMEHHYKIKLYPVLIASATSIDGTTAANAYSYQWSLNGVEIPGATNQTLTVNQPGDYTVTVSGPTDMLCENFESQIITVSASPSDFSVELTTFAFADNHVIQVEASTTIPNVEFEYSLDDINGPYQDSGTFEGVTPGSHTVYIRDKNGCDTVSENVFVIDYPKFFSPNGDGLNDTWMIYGIDGIPISQIYIFDRYGKLLKQLDPDGDGWNGTYNNSPMPADDYWFKIIYLEDNTQKEFTAHFALKR